MAFSLLSTTLFVLATTTAAQLQCPADWIMGSSGGGAGPTGADWDTIVSKNRNPNATSSVTFTPNWNVASGRSRDLGQWTWTVNVTDISTSNFHGPILGGGGGISNRTGMHFVNTVHDFQWPGGGELAPYLKNATNNASGTSGNLCLDALNLRALPANVTDKYQASDNGDCSRVLGSECVRAYLAAVSVGNRGSSCSAGPSFASLKECNSTLAVAPCSAAFAFGLGNSTQASFRNGTDITNATLQYPLRSGDGVFYSSTSEQQGGNNTQYERQTHYLQAVVLSGAVQPVMLCQRVNNTASPAIPGLSAGSSLNGASAGVVALGGMALLFSLL